MIRESSSASLISALREHRRVGRRLRLALELGAGRGVELDHAVILVGGILGRRIARALARAHVDQHRAVALGVAHVAQHRQQVVEIVTVERPDVVEAELLEQRAAGDHAAGVLFRLARRLGQRPRHEAGQLLGDVPEGHVGLRRDHAREVVVHGAGRGRDRHVVVVQDHDQAGVHGAGVVHGLVGHAGAHRAVADHRHDVEVGAGEIARPRHAERRRDRGRAVRRAERIVLALGPLGEAGQPAGLAQRPDPVAPAGQDLVGIGLMADIPDQLVLGRVEHVVQRHRQLDDAEPGAEMAAGDRDGIDRLGAQLVRQLAKAVLGQPPQVGRELDAVEQRSVYHRLRSAP